MPFSCEAHAFVDSALARALVAALKDEAIMWLLLSKYDTVNVIINKPTTIYIQYVFLLLFEVHA